MPANLTAHWLSAGTDDDARALLSMTLEQHSASNVQIYHLTGGGKDMDELGRRLARIDVPAHYQAPSHLLLSRFPTMTDALEWDAAVRQADDTDQHLVVEHAAYVPVTQVPGPQHDQAEQLAPSVQFGTFSMATPDSEWELANWYEQMRLPSVTEMPGAVRATRFVSVCGPVKFAVLYEFSSLEERLDQFEKPHEVHALDVEHPTGHVVHNTVHAPMSPSIGYGLLKPANANAAHT